MEPEMPLQLFWGGVLWDVDILVLPAASWQEGLSPLTGGGCVYDLHNYLHLCTWNPNDLYFWRSTTHQNKAFSNQNKGHLGSGYVSCIYIKYVKSLNGHDSVIPCRDAQGTLGAVPEEKGTKNQLAKLL